MLSQQRTRIVSSQTPIWSSEPVTSHSAVWFAGAHAVAAQDSPRWTQADAYLACALTRALLGYFRTLRTAGGGPFRPPPAISRTDGRRETGEAAFERSHREASRSIIKLTLKGQRSGQGQVKGQKCRFSLRRLLRLYHMKERLEIHTWCFQHIAKGDSG